MTGPHRQTSATCEVSLGWLPTIDRIQLPKLLKEQLTQALILTYPKFLPSSEPFSLQTDASAVGIGMVLEQAGYVVAYARRSLSQSERNYSIIQQERLAITQFCHSLLGRPFCLLMDHAQLQ